MSLPADLGLYVVAAALCLVGGLLAMMDAALSRVSPARVEEMVREGVRGTCAGGFARCRTVGDVGWARRLAAVAGVARAGRKGWSGRCFRC